MRASDRVYGILREEIIGWHRPPGTILGEVELADQLGVSRTPVREAVSRLLGDGLAAPRPGRGVVVAEVSADGVREMFELREALDTQTAALAARRADPRVFDRLAERLERMGAALAGDDADRSAYYALVASLDEALDEAADSAWLRHAQEQLRAHLQRVRRLSRKDEARLRAAAAEHAQIARAVASGNPELARAATLVHLDRALSAILRAVRRLEHQQPAPTPVDVRPLGPAAPKIERTDP
ncbi:GntR family transcriptional regulator [Rothia sp. BD8]|uniref:GntR family transcriptional regulator n=1 Tax=Rothia sp. BD8 TaxID=2953894 RepID=UPI003849ACE6